MIEITNNNSSEHLIAELLKAKKELISSKLIINKKDNHKYPIIEAPFQIPKNWKWIFLSDISIIQEGPGIRKHQYQDDGIQFLTVTNILEGSVDLLKSQKYISLEEYEEKYKHYSINKGDIVTACSGASWGKSAVYEHDKQLMLNTSTLRLRFFNDLGENRYLYYLTKSDYFKANLASHSTGQQANYGYSHYSKIPIPLPPHFEQKQIVKILDEAFVAIDKAKTNIKKNIQNAEELFQSKLNHIFSQKSDSWEEKPLGEVCELIGGGTPSKSKEEYYDGNIFWATVRDMNSDKLSETDHKISLEGLKNSSSKIIPKDHIIIATRVGLGKVCILEQDTAINQDLKGIIPNPKFQILNEYIFWWYKSISNKVIKAGTGATVQGVKLPFVNGLSFPLMNIENQAKLVNTLNQFSNDINTMEINYQNKILNLNELKKSILQKAFAGELTNNSVEV